MTERLRSGLSPQALELLGKLQLAPAVHNQEPIPNRISLKDRPYADIIHNRPELGTAITSTMQRLEQRGLAVPVIHITSRAVRFPDGSERSTGYLDSIVRDGFRPRDTNVAALMKRGDVTDIADPTYFAENPHKLLRSMTESLGHYAHHGSRTNKQSLGNMRDEGKGVPTMLIIDPTDVPLIPGTDYDDHYLLGQAVSPSHIIGILDLDGKRWNNDHDVATVASDFLDTIDEYVSVEPTYLSSLK